MPHNHSEMNEQRREVFRLSPFGPFSLLLAGALGMHAAAQAQSVQTFQTLQNPPVFTAQDNVASTSSAPAGVRHGGSEAVLPPARQQNVRLNVEYVNTYIWNPVSGKYDRVRLRSYHGRSDRPLVAPTINIQPGTRLNIRLNNKLPADDPSCQHREGADHNTPNCFNSTNLHTHGLWVDPNGISDNIFLTVKPGQTQRYAIDIPSDHPAGTFWYHSHLHGSTALQVSSGMAGALIVRGNRQPTASRPGDLDTLLRPDARHRVQERVLVMQQIQYSCRDEKGEIKKEADGIWKCDEGDVGGMESYDGLTGPNWGASGRFTTINGHTLPTFVGARSGRFERWRMIHAGVRETIKLEFREANLPFNRPVPNFSRMRPEVLRRFVNNVCKGQPLPQHLVAADGLTMNNVLTTSATTFQPGYRWDSVMVFPRPGYYCILDSGTPRSGSVNEVSVQQLLGVVAVAPGAVQMRDDQIPAFFRREMVQLAVRNVSGAMRRQVAAGLQSSLSLAHYAPHKTISRSELTNPNDIQRVTFNITGEGNRFSFQVDGKPYDPKVLGRLLKLGDVQEWHLRSDVAAHPFHIHVNPFQIVAILDPQGRDVSGFDVPDDADGTVDTQFRGLKGVWKDTIFVKSRPRGSTSSGQYTVIVRSRYQRYAGDFVLHCHILDHEDLGMMQHVRIWDPARPETRDAPVPGHAHH